MLINPSRVTGGFSGSITREKQMEPARFLRQQPRNLEQLQFHNEFAETADRRVGIVLAIIAVAMLVSETVGSNGHILALFK
jgi:hypothetical protein